MPISRAVKEILQKADQETMTYPDTQLFIHGKWQAAADGKTLAVQNPATNQEIGRVARASLPDLERALESTSKGFAVWRSTPAIERAKVMRRAAGLLRERCELIARIMTLEQGKPVAEAFSEVMGGADVIDWFADEGLRVYGRLVPPRNMASRQMVLKDAVGPVAAFTPWNFPINQAVRKVSAALATGCSIVLKAPEETPAGPAALVQAFADAGLPAGVLNLVYGDPEEISKCLISHPVIRKVSFTGSTAVGKRLASLAGQHMKRVTMELGGHAPVLIAEDADVELAVSTMGGTKFRNAGQICVAPTRFLVHESVQDAFLQSIVRHAATIKVGDGLDETTKMGPLANERRLIAMRELTEDAVHRGADLVFGGERIGSAGNFWAPTVLANVPTEARLFNDEPFGPIIAMQVFGAMSEAIVEANRLSYGLAAYAFTNSMTHLHTLSQELEVGMVWINQPPAAWPEMPFGGVKDSGYGSEGGPEALDAYLTTRVVAFTVAPNRAAS